MTHTHCTTPTTRTRPRRTRRIALLAPPWIPVPPPAYGGIESVVGLLCEELVRRGHDVTLFAAPGSGSSATVHSPLADAHPDTIGSALHESDHVVSVWEEIARLEREGRPFDVLHDHSGFTALAFAGAVSAPVVHTLHGPFTAETGSFYARHGHKAHLVAISNHQRAHAPSGVNVSAVVPNPVVVEDWPLRMHKGDYLLWLGRMDPIKGAHRAIDAARRSGQRLVLAGPVQTGQHEFFVREIEPHLDGDMVTYVGEVGGRARTELFADAKALLMPIRWPEPFGMVMVEALACGTPVITFPEGAASEIVIDGETGFHVRDEEHMAQAVQRVTELDPVRCRESVAERFDVGVVASGYEAVYESAIAAGAPSWRRLAGHVRTTANRPAGVPGQGRHAGALSRADRLIAHAQSRASSATGWA